MFYTTKFDKFLNNISGLTWLPWIGNEYSYDNFLILGESHYRYDNFSTLDIEKNRMETRECVENYVDSGREAGNQYKTYAPMEAVLRSSMIFSGTRETSWSRIAFMNLIQSCMDSNQTRPRWDLFLNGWSVVLQVIRIIRPNACICFSTNKMHNRVNFNRLEEFKQEMEFDYQIIPNEDTETRISRCIVATPGCVCIGEYSCPVIFVQHASRIKGEAIDSWAEIIKRNI